MKKFFQNQHWIKMLTRDIPLIRLVIIYKTCSECAKKDIGLHYPTGFTIIHDGIGSIYRSKERLAEYSEDFLRVKNKKQFFEKNLRKAKLVKEKTEKDIKFCENKLKLKKNLNHRDLLKLFKILHQTFKNFWNLQYFPMALELALNNYGRNDIVSRYKKYFVGIRQQTQDTIVELEDLIDSVLRKISKIKGLNNLIFYATPSEVISNKLIKKHLIERKKYSLLGYRKKKFIIYQGKKARDLAKYLALPEKKSAIAKIIKGNSTYRGKVKGVVRIILYRKDLNKIKGGEILVASMTEPYCTPFLKKVRAIITDEGGITCHAAIISRELKIPCIIGTKIATKVLKDGDLVEVDADKGIVRILKK